MTKLEWCRKVAPDVYKRLPDDELLAIMQPTLAKLDLTVFDEPKASKLSDEDIRKLKTLDGICTLLCREFGDNIAFKGGYILTQIMPEQARFTRDIDFSLQNGRLYERVKIVLIKLGDTLIRNGTIDRYVIKPEIKPSMSGGITMYKDAKDYLGVDVGWHRIDYGIQDITLPVGSVQAFSVERMLSDKISAILSRKRFRRPKDVYDVYCITNCFDFDPQTVNDYILLRTEGVGAEWINYPFNENVVREYAHAYDKLLVKSVVTGAEIIKPVYTDVMARFTCIADMLSSADCSKYYWSHEDIYFMRKR